MQCYHYTAQADGKHYPCKWRYPMLRKEPINSLQKDTTGVENLYSCFDAKPWLGSPLTGPRLAWLCLDSLNAAIEGGEYSIHSATALIQGTSHFWWLQYNFLSVVVDLFDIKRHLKISHSVLISLKCGRSFHWKSTSPNIWPDVLLSYNMYCLPNQDFILFLAHKIQ